MIYSGDEVYDDETTSGPYDEDQSGEESDEEDQE